MAEMTKRKVLVCGASGFIGRNLFEHFSKKSDLDVYGTYLSNNRLNEQRSPHPRLWRVNLTDRDHTNAIVSQNFDCIINCAAKTEGSGAYNAEASIATNTRINLNLIEAAHLHKVKHVIFLSCTVMYPSGDRPLKEDEYDLNDIHPKYFMGARMKVFAEDLCRFYAGLSTTKYTAVRHTNIYGPHDKFDLQRGHVLSATIEKVMKADKEIKVWGHGKESRDFLHIQDLIEFIQLAIEKQENNFEIFNVGYGKTYSIKELVRKIVSCSGKDLNIIHDLEKPSIETNMNIDVEKASHLLGWKARIGLSKGLIVTLDWYKKNHNPE